MTAGPRAALEPGVADPAERGGRTKDLSRETLITEMMDLVIISSKRADETVHVVCSAGQCSRAITVGSENRDAGQRSHVFTVGSRSVGFV